MSSRSEKSGPSHLDLPPPRGPREARLPSGESLQLPMDVLEIQKCLPHRPPFLLIDRVLDFEPLSHIFAIKNVSISEPVLAGHFPGMPVVPGVYIVEAVAQAAGILRHLSFDVGAKICLLTEVSSARFRKPVVPGDVLRLSVKVAKHRSPFFWFDAVADVEGEVVAEVKLSACIK